MEFPKPTEDYKSFFKLQLIAKIMGWEFKTADGTLDNEGKYLPIHKLQKKKGWLYPDTITCLCITVLEKEKTLSAIGYGYPLTVCQFLRKVEEYYPDYKVTLDFGSDQPQIS